MVTINDVCMHINDINGGVKSLIESYFFLLVVWWDVAVDGSRYRTTGTISPL